MNTFGNEIAPYAIELCQSLGESFVRLMEVNNKGQGDDLEVDNETSLSADGLMSAIRRIL